MSIVNGEFKLPVYDKTSDKEVNDQSLGGGNTLPCFSCVFSDICKFREQVIGAKYQNFSDQFIDTPIVHTIGCTIKTKLQGVVSR